MATLTDSPLRSECHDLNTKTNTSNMNGNTGTTTNCLLAGLDATNHIHLIIGTNPLAAARCAQSLAAGAHPIIIAPEGSELHYGLQGKIDDGSVKWERKVFEDGDVMRLGREEVGGFVDAVFVTGGPRDEMSTHISLLCKRNRIPINVVDAPALCTFTLLSTHTDGPLQIGVTTNGRGCKLASRIRREIASSLPPQLGAACARLGEVRRRIQDDDAIALGDLEDSLGQGAEFNRLVREGEEREAKGRRMRWLGQVCEYWPLSRLASVADEDVDRLLAAYPGVSSTLDSTSPRTDNTTKKQKLGRIILAGSGPGHPDLLTRATHKAILSADLILADKLVPAPILALIPRRTPVHIARKFPGNADAAQAELQSLALEAASQGKTVLRLKQGDPFVYGRGGEEVLDFERAGFGGDKGKVLVLPGMTSALSAALFAGVPVTMRDVADQVLICTGTGKKGKPPAPPEFVASRTVVFLMALHRIGGLVKELTTRLDTPEPPPTSTAPSETPPTPQVPIPDDSTRPLWPLTTPCAVIERASCPDQRIIRTTLAHVVQAIESEGSRPPGLLVVGAACEALYAPEKGRAWAVEEGFRGVDVQSGNEDWEGVLEKVERMGDE